MAQHRQPRPHTRWPVARMLGLALGGYTALVGFVLPQPHYMHALTVVVGLIIIGYCARSARLRALADDLTQGFARLLTVMAGLVALQSMSEALALVAGAVTLSLISWAVHGLGQATPSGMTP